MAPNHEKPIVLILCPLISTRFMAAAYIFLVTRAIILFLPPATVVLTGLEPNTTYEVRVAAVNGKGQGEFSHTETFQTLPIRKSPGVTWTQLVSRHILHNKSLSAR